MKKLITTVILLASIALNVIAQQEIQMFFDSELGLQDFPNNRLAFSHDGGKIATVFGKGKIIIWDTVTGGEKARLVGHGNDNLSNIMFCSNDRKLASYNNVRSDSTLKIWNAITGELACSITHTGLQNINFSIDGNHIAGTYEGSGEYGVKIWNTVNGNELKTLIGHTGRVNSVTYSPDGKYILTASQDGSIRIWDAANGETLKIIRHDNVRRFLNAVYCPNGRFISAYTLGNGYSLYIFNAETSQEIRSIPIQQLNIYDLVFSPDSKHLLVNTQDNNINPLIKIFYLETGRDLQNINTRDMAIAYSNDGQKLFTYSEYFFLDADFKSYGASYANILDAATGRKIGVIGYEPLNIGAKAFADLQIARFLNDAAAVSRNEAILNFITGRGDATRAEIEAFYRNNVRTQIEVVVDMELITGKSVNSDTRRVIYEIVTTPLTNFYLSPTQANFDKLKGSISSLNNIRALNGFNSNSINRIADLLRYGERGKFAYDWVTNSYFLGMNNFRNTLDLAEANNLLGSSNIAQIIRRVITEAKNWQLRTASQKFGISITGSVEWEKISLSSAINALNSDLARMLRQ